MASGGGAVASDGFMRSLSGNDHPISWRTVGDAISNCTSAIRALNMPKRLPNKWTKVYCLVGMVVLMLACSSLNLPGAVEEKPQPTASVVQPTQSEASLVERRLVVLEWPEKIRVGDADRLRLSLELDEEGNLTPTAVMGGNEVEGTPVEIPDLYDTHNLVVECRLDLAGVEIKPEGRVSQPLRPGQDLSFYWSISPGQAGRYRGTLWIFLNMVPKTGGDMDQVALLAPQVEIQAVSVVGLPANVVRWGGLVSSALSLVFGFPFVEDLLKRFWKSIRRTNPPEIVKSG